MRTSFFPSLIRNASKRSRQAPEPRYNYNPNPFEIVVDPEAHKFPILTAHHLQKSPKPPRRCRILARDFIEDSLYNPHYGYFSRQATIFTSKTPQGFQFGSLKDSKAFDAAIAEKYAEIEGPASREALPGDVEASARQIWHTPTELFKPWYARAVARFIVSQHNQRSAATPLLIYEAGGGNGILMQGVLGYLKEAEPEIYDTTKYHIIEISPRLAQIQAEKAQEHPGKAAIINKDVFDWNQTITDPCFFLAFEVLDNLSHDVVRYVKDATRPAELVQCYVSVTSSGDFVEEYTAINDPLIEEFLDVYAQTNCRPLFPQHPPLLRWLLNAIPFSANLSEPIFLPTKAFALLQRLNKHFPQSNIVLSDFSTLPDTISGRNAPVVQTRYKGQTVPCTTYLVQQGYFDIFFPTDFQLLSQLYSVTHQSERKMAYSSQRKFLEQWGEVEKTRLQNGDNPMLEHYANAAFAWTT